ncbi:hypothetical protein TEA_005334 [Camellia sinensis var. sinensis]|uniref:Uncharacterized protein n=1 Tax=Camellia sinensis var. sinensis TaxID=542762 RepID=A0A4S4EQQ6_CAMSN|nr:hypothetical protein TEA_005334 [Camellia sinensis var. sinensis]
MFFGLSEMDQTLTNTTTIITITATAATSTSTTTPSYHNTVATTTTTCTIIFRVTAGRNRLDVLNVGKWSLLLAFGSDILFLLLKVDLSRMAGVVWIEFLRSGDDAHYDLAIDSKISNLPDRI